MKATELRIGNWVRFNNSIIPCHSFDINYIFTVKDGHKFYKPLKLNLKRLKKFGFELVQGSNRFYVIGYYDLENPFYLRLINNEFRYYTGSSFVTLKYVHQLQNLYFAITGQELEIV